MSRPRLVQGVHAVEGGRGRWLAAVILLGAVIFALQGGEYSTWNWITLRREEGETGRAVTQLKAEVDSLKKLKKQVETDPGMQERIAREKFGMIARGEYLYIIETDSLDDK